MLGIAACSNTGKNDETESSEMETESEKTTEIELSMPYTIKNTTIDLSTSELQIKSAGIIAEDESSYYFYTTTDKQDYAFLKVSKIDNKIETLKMIDSSRDLFHMSIYNEDLLVEMAKSNSDGSYTYEFYLGYETIFSFNIHGYPEISRYNDICSVFYAEPIEGDKEKSVIAIVDLANKTMEAVIEIDYIYQEGYYTGDVISKACMDENYIYYQVVKMEHGEFTDDNAGECAIYRYSLKDGTTEKLMEYPEKILYMNVINGCLIIQDYILYRDVIECHILVTNENGYDTVDLTDINGGNNIMDSFAVSEDELVVDTGEQFILYNMKDKSLNTVLYDEETDPDIGPVSQKSRLVKTISGFAYSDYKDNIITLYEYIRNTK